MLVSAVCNLRRPLAVGGIALIAILAPACAAAESPSAHTLPRARASGQNFEESLGMRIKKKHGNRLTAKGGASGTVDAKATLKLHLITGSKARATFFGRNSHGTLSGTIAARYRVSGAISRYTGRITSLTGTGRYAHAKSLGISFSGTVNRRSHKVTGSLTGRWHA
ncbi:MAG: hypothetical protein ACTHK6_09295 [Solirubrobacterales bacterium]